LIAHASSEMAGHRDLPAAHHHEAALADPRIVKCFAGFVELEGELAALLGGAHAPDIQTRGRSSEPNRRRIERL
jgi:hypothetical protein